MKNTGLRGLWGLVFLVGVLLGGGCVSQKLEPEHRPQLGVSQSSNGWLMISLDTTVGYKYKILYQDPKDQSWKPLDEGKTIRGTGETIEIRKRFNPRKQVPRFTVHYSKG